jgi:hypothetical protein
MQAICVLGGTAAVIVGFGPSSGIGIAGILWTAWGMAFGLIDYWKQRRTP